MEEMKIKRIVNNATYTTKHMVVKQILKDFDNGYINDEINIQRPYVWKNNDRKSGLIRSLILDRPIPPLYFSDTSEDDGVEKWDLIDGKQRILTIHKFVNDDFKLSGLDPIVVTDENDEDVELDINGLTYSELREEFQDAILSYNFQIEVIFHADPSEIVDIFYNLNNGQTINAACMNRLKAKSREEITELGADDVFTEMLSQTAMEGHVNEDLVGKTHAMLFSEEQPSMDNKWIRPYVRDAEFSDDDVAEIKKVYQRIRNVHELIEDKRIQKRLYTKTHFLSVTPIMRQSILDGRTDEEMMKWFVTFFAGKKSATISKSYNSNISSGSGKKESVATRVREIEKSYNNFFQKSSIVNFEDYGKVANE